MTNTQPSAQHTTAQTSATHFIHFFGLRRSGNHPLIHWLLEGLKSTGKSAAHFNSVADSLAPERNREEIEAHIAQDHPDIALINYEDWPFSKRLGLAQYKAFSSNTSTHVVLLRSFPNLMASQIQRRNVVEQSGRTFQIQDKSLETVRDLWVEFARDMLGCDASAFTSILYDTWVAERAYRDNIAKRIGFANQDLGIDHVPDFGGGSSFEGMSMQNRGREMRTLERWQLLAQDKEGLATYSSLLTPEIVNLNKEIFGADPTI